MNFAELITFDITGLFFAILILFDISYAPNIPKILNIFFSMDNYHKDHVAR